MEQLSRWLSTTDMEQPQPIGYSIPKQTQAKMRMQRRIPYSKIGSKTIRYDRKQIDKWLEDHAVISV